MIFINETKPLRIYNKKFLLPTKKKGIKRKGNAVLLLTPNVDSSLRVINNKMILPKYYESYYLEKDVSFFINNQNLLESYITKDEYMTVTESSKGIVYENGGYIEKETNLHIRYNNESIYESILPYFNFETISKINEEFYRVDLSGLNISILINPINESIKKDNIDLYEESCLNENYCKSMIHQYLIMKINPNCNSLVAESIAYLNINKETTINETTELGIQNLLEQILMYGGDRRHLIENNLLLNLYILENKSAISALKRKITYSTRKATIHATNKINKTDNDILMGAFSAPNIEPPSITIPTPSDILDGGTKKDEDTETIDESCSIPYNVLNENCLLTEDYLKIDDNITYFIEDSYFLENNVYDERLRKILYKERLRNNKEVFQYYDIIKSHSYIKHTYLNYKRYKNLNLFVDLSYYNEVFFKNNMFKLNRGVDLYFEFMSRFIDDTRLSQEGYETKAILIPLNDWFINPKTRMWLYREDINPISVMIEMMRRNILKLKEVFKDMDIVFLNGDTNYFKINMSTFDVRRDLPKLINILRKLDIQNPSSDKHDDELMDTDLSKDSKEVIIDKIRDDLSLDKEDKILVSNLTGDGDSIKKTEKEIIKDKEKESIKKSVEDKIEDVASKSDSIETAIEKLDDDEEFKRLVLALNDEEPDKPVVNPKRAARLDQLNSDILNKEVKGMKVKDIIEKKEKYNVEKLEKISLPVDSINKEWQELSYVSMAEQYDPDVDIMAILVHLSKMSYPLSIRDIEITDTSTSEDYIKTYKVQMESYSGKRFSLKFDIPELVNNSYMQLRGNKKNISSQLFLLPLVKTEESTVQIVSNYSKIFVEVFGDNRGKSNIYTDMIIKTLNKLPSKGNKNIEYTAGNNGFICSKYDLPIDYIDLAQAYTYITIGDKHANHTTFYFDQSELRDKFEKQIDYSKGLPIGVDYINNKNEIIYYSKFTNSMCSEFIFNILISNSDFAEVSSKLNKSVKYTYSKASIMNMKIPVIVLASYYEGLTTVLNKANIKYELTEKRPVKSLNNDFIKFSDGYLSYPVTYQSSMLINGLKECPTEDYSITDINKKYMYLDFLDIYGGKIKSDGLDNFYDLMLDPITIDVLNHMELEPDLVKLLILSNNLLCDNSYTKHGNMAGRRIRRNELIAGYTYKALSSAYGSYANNIRHNRDVPMTIKQSAVIDAILLDNTSADLSILNAVGEKESYDTVTPKGLSGMNSDRSYSLDKRAFDDSMINTLALSTGFATTVGINRQATIDANVDTVRGYVKPSETKEMTTVNTLCMTEALTPFGVTRDDPFRSAMTFVQTSRHGMRTKVADSLIVTNGSDQALPYMVSDIFAYKSKGDGEVKEIADDYMIVTYKDGNSEYVDLSTKVEKNSSSGFYVTLKLDTDLKVGSKVKKGSILAYDKTSFDTSKGIYGNPAYKVGTLTCCALLDNDEGFEDSAIISQPLAKAMGSDIIVQKKVSLNRNTNIYNMIEEGAEIQEGDPLFIMQNAFEDEDVNVLLKNLSGSEEDITDLGRIKVRSSITGVVEKIVVKRTCELEELSPSLQAFCKKYEKKIASKKQVMKKYKLENQYKTLEPDYKLEPTGSLKDTPDGVSITFFLKYEDILAIGDKVVYWSANKGVTKYIIPEGEEPYFNSRPDEKVHSFVSISACNGRMITSIQNIGVLNRLIIEMGRTAQDMAGIEYNVNLFE